MTAPKCPDCNVTMEEGYAVDSGRFNGPEVLSWYSGQPSLIQNVFGPIVKLPAAGKLGIESWRCPQCGLLREYALKKPKM
jgi:hypothetical protein